MGTNCLVEVSSRFFAALAAYLEAERPADAGSDRVFVVLKGPRRGKPLAARGLDQVLSGARDRAGACQDVCVSEVGHMGVTGSG